MERTFRKWYEESMADGDVVQVGADVFLCGGTDVNWVLLGSGSDLTLIDAGYPRDLGAVEASIRSIGSRPEDVRAILLTHAHVDHMGAINHFHAQYGTPAYMRAIETAHARREYLEQVGELDIARNAWRPGVIPWSLRIVRAGATNNVTIPHAQGFPATSAALDLPGGPVPVPTPGHTSGHTAFYLPDIGAVISGDALVTGHPTSRAAGPQLLPAMFAHDQARALSALEQLENLAADLLIPGHGPVHRGPIREAVLKARERAQRSVR